MAVRASDPSSPAEGPGTCRAWWHRAACALAVLVLPAAAGAEASPYYLGVSETVYTDTNLYRLGDRQSLPAGVDSRSELILATALVGGFDQNYSRQHLSGSVALRNNRYTRNSPLSYNGYSLDLGWDWSTVNNLSGTVQYGAKRSLRRFDSAETLGTFAGQNIETDRNLDLTARLGLVTRLTAVGTLSHQEVDYSAAAYRSAVTRINVASLGVQYQAAGRLLWGAAWRDTGQRYPAAADRVSRHDLDLTLGWTPSDLSNVKARVSRTSTTHSARHNNDFQGTTWQLAASTQATGKLKLGTSLARDVGTTTSLFSNPQDGSTIQGQFNRRSTSLGLTADFQASAKTGFNSSWTQVWRELSPVRADGSVAQGSDRTSTFSLGARWAASRSTQFSCNWARELRSADATVSAAYSSTSVNCSGQFVIQ